MSGRANAAPFSAEQLLAVLDAGREFWTALAGDDDATLLRTLVPHALEALLAGPGTGVATPAVQGAGLARSIRDFIGFSVEDCRRIRVYSRVSRLGPSSIRILYLLVDEEPEPIPGLTPIHGRRIEFELDGGRWLVEPTRPHDRPAIEMIDLGPMLDRVSSDPAPAPDAAPPPASEGGDLPTP